MDTLQGTAPNLLTARYVRCHMTDLAFVPRAQAP